MHKLIFAIFVLIPIYCYSQDFLHSSDYVYGVGRGDSVLAADSAAILSLSMSLQTSVVNTSHHTIKEVNGKITSTFKKNVSLESSIDLVDSRNYVLQDDKGYIVYRYFNKKEYVDTRISQYLFFMQKAEEIRGSNVNHERNLILGYYYLGYSAINTPIMDIYADMESEKADIIKKAQEIYYCGDYGFPMLICKKWDGYEISMGGQIDRFGDAEFIDLEGFEYFNGKEWIIPEHLPAKCNLSTEASNNPNINVKYRRGVVEVDKPQVLYRILYEKYEDGRYVKIQVPEEWYFSLLQIRNPMFLF